MRILNFDLLAFGPFTDTHLELDGTATDFHVFFGNNEAGKSSALRALSALLFGVPTRTTDHFVHEHTALRIGGRLRHSDGSELIFVRRKGRKNTLLASDGTALPDTALNAFLAGVDANQFETAFGIDHARLEEGAREILKGGGEVGQSLFAAGLGTANLREVLTQLDEQASSLFRQQGHKPTINATLTQYRDALKRIRDLSMSSRAWSDLEKDIAKSQQKRDEVAQEQTDLATKKNRLSRLLKLLPYLGRRRALLEELAPLADVVRFGAGISDSRIDAIRMLEDANKAKGVAESQMKHAQEKVRGLSVSDETLRDEGAITALHEELGSYRKAAQDAGKLQGRQDQLRTDAATILAELRPELTLDDAENLQLETAAKARIRDLAEKHQALVEGAERASQDVENAEASLMELKRELSDLDELSDETRAKLVVGRLRKSGDIEAALAEKATACEAARKGAEVALAALGFWSGTLEEVEELAVPALETVDRFQEEIRASDDRASRAASDTSATRKQLVEQDEKLEALRLAGEVLTETDLAAARMHRTDGWQLVRRAWLDQEDIDEAARAFDPERPLQNSYEHSVEKADEVADRLRREADRVARRAELEAHRERLADELARLAADAAVLATEREQLQARWEQIWSPLGISPLPPREMRAWLSRHSIVVSQASQFRDLTVSVESLDRTIAAARNELNDALGTAREPTLGEQETLAAGLQRAEQVVAAIEAIRRRRSELKKGIEQLETQSDAARAQEKKKGGLLETWRADWANSIAVLGLPGTARPAEANAVLDRLNDLFRNIDETKGLKSRLKGITRDADDFTRQGKALTARIAPDLIGSPPDHAVETLWVRLAISKQAAATLEQINEQLDTLKETIDGAEEDIKLATARLDGLCAQFGCMNLEELEELERQSALGTELDGKLAQLDEHLLEMGGGATVEQLVAEEEATDTGTLEARIDELERRSKELEERRSSLDQLIGGRRADLDRVDGSSQAASEASRAQGLLARIRTDSEQYVRLRLASELLRREIERYREANQGPLLERASGLFEGLTLGSFSGLASDFDDKDQPILLGVRANGDRVGVNGMSDGTCDQLYLSIRLATLEQYLAAHEPIPFVVDDILIRFDDQRAGAALHALRELSSRTQVLFFTHHQRLVELAQELGEGAVAIHAL